MKKYSYVGVSFIVLIFGIIFVPKIVDRIKDTKIVSNSRMSADNKITNEPNPSRIRSLRGTWLVHTLTHVPCQNQSWLTPITQVKTYKKIQQI